MSQAVSGQIESLIRMSASGEVLVSSGFADDVAHATQIGVSQVVPVMVNGAFADCNKNHDADHPDATESSLLVAEILTSKQPIPALHDIQMTKQRPKTVNRNIADM